MYLADIVNNVSIGGTTSSFKLDVVGDIGITNGSLWMPVYPSDDGLVGYWSFSEGSGTTAYDKGPYGNDGTVINPIWTNGKYGNALYLNGSTTYVNIADSPSLSIASNNYTFALWIKAATYQPNAFNAIISKK